MEAADVNRQIDITNIKSKAEAALNNNKLLEHVNIKESFNEIKNDRELITHSMIGALKIFSIGFLISLIIFMLISNIDAVQEMQDSYKYIAMNDGVQKFRMAPNALDLFNMSFQSSWFLEGSAKVNEYDLGKLKVKIDVAFLILLLIPFIAIFISQRKLFQNKNSTARNIKEYLLTSAFFSALLSIIMLFNKKVMIVTDSYSGTYINVTGYFGILSNLIMIFLVAFLMQLIISAFMKKEKLSNIVANENFHNIIDAINSFLKNLSYITILCLIALVVLSIYIINYELFDQSIFMILLLIPNLFIAIWLFISGNGIVFSIPESSYGDLFIGNAWNGIVALQDLFYVKLIDALPLYLLIIVIMIGVLFVFVQAIQKLSQENYFKNLLYFASCLTIINLSLAFFTRLQIGYKAENIRYLMEFMADNLGIASSFANQSISIGYPLVQVGLITFFSVLVLGGLIYLLSNQNLYIKINDFVLRKERAIKVGYGLTLLCLFIIIAVKITDYSHYIDYLF